jgi:hypothetical protein
VFDAINTFGVSAGLFASSIQLFPQFSTIFAPGSIPGSSTNNGRAAG